MILDTMGPTALSVEHIGSTSVPGLAAKLVIDLLLVVADIDDEDCYVVPLESIGPLLRVREHEHRMLRTTELTYRVHVLPPETAEQTHYLNLCDWLRVSAADHDLYASTKRTLSASKWSDMNHYADARAWSSNRFWRMHTTGAQPGPSVQPTSDIHPVEG